MTDIVIHNQLLSGPSGPLFFNVTVITTNCCFPCSNTVMNIRHIAIGFAALTIVISTSAFADEIYKWTDEDGNVHYGDRPSGEPTEERLQVTYNRTNSEALDNRVAAQRDAEDSRRSARTEATEQKQAAEDDRVAAEDKQALCETSRAKVDTMRAAPRIYREDEKGERVFLDDVQRAESIAEAETRAKEACET